MIEVREKLWRSHGRANNGMISGLSSQVTVCRFDGVDFAVRENVTGKPYFHISSNERWGDKRGAKPADHRQVLELLAPADQWDRIAKLVADADTKKRPICRNETFTWASIERLRTDDPRFTR